MSKKSSWDLHKDDPIWREQKRQRGRAYWFKHNRPERLKDLPVKRGSSRTPEELEQTKARKAVAREAKRRATAERQAKILHWRDCRITPCKGGCGVPFMRSEIPGRLCRSCCRAKTKKYRLKHPDKVRQMHRAARHRRRARERNAEGYCSPRDWLAILKRYRGLCQHCGSTDKLTWDHIIPLAKGGSNDPTNIQPLCHLCNSIKCDVLTGAVQSFLPGIVKYA